jgi:glycosyltransferase involved in cell wall biosynthesis
MNYLTQVSVVMSVYNGAQYLSESIESILSQEGVDFEFIIVNDGSTDKSLEILRDYSNKDNRIKVIHQENRGLTKALIKGCSEAKGQYIARQDVGDISVPDRLFLQKKILDADSQIVFVSCWTDFVGPEKEFLYTSQGSGEAVKPVNIISLDEKYGSIDGPTHHGSVMFRKKAYITTGGYRTEFYYGQDWDLWYRLAEIGKFQMMEKVLYKARITPNGISFQKKLVQNKFAKLSYVALLERLQGRSDKDKLDKAQKIINEKRCEKYSCNAADGFYFIGEALRRNNNENSKYYLKKAFKTNPFMFKVWVRLLQLQLKK